MFQKVHWSKCITERFFQMIRSLCCRAHPVPVRCSALQQTPRRPDHDASHGGGREGELACHQRRP